MGVSNRWPSSISELISRMEMRLRAPVTKGYFLLLGALRLVNAASPRNIDQKKISSGTQGTRKQVWMKILGNSNHAYTREVIQILRWIKSSQKWNSKRESRHSNKKKKKDRKILPSGAQYHQAVPNLKKILMSKWNLIKNQSLPKEICKEPPIISYKRGHISLKDILVRSKL